MGAAPWVWSQEGVAWEKRRRLSQELGAGVEQAFVYSGCGRVEVGRTPRLGLGSPKAAWSGNPSLETMWAWPHVGLVWEQCVSARIGCKGRVGGALEPPAEGQAQNLGWDTGLLKAGCAVEIHSLQYSGG